MKLYKQLLLNTEVTLNNRRYPLEVIESIRDQINSRDEDRNLGTVGYEENLEIDLSKVAFKYSNAVIENNALYVDIEMLDTPLGKSLNEVLGDMRFRPAGTGTFDGGMPVETMNLLKVPSRVSMGYKILSVAAINPSEDALQMPKDE
jgi:hypothetical protein